MPPPGLTETPEDTLLACRHYSLSGVSQSTRTTELAALALLPLPYHGLEQGCLGNELLP